MVHVMDHINDEIIYLNKLFPGVFRFNLNENLMKMYGPTWN